MESFQVEAWKTHYFRITTGNITYLNTGISQKVADFIGACKVSRAPRFRALVQKLLNNLVFALGRQIENLEIRSAKVQQMHRRLQPCDVAGIRECMHLCESFWRVKIVTQGIQNRTWDIAFFGFERTDSTPFP